MNAMPLGAEFVAELPWTRIQARSVMPPRLAQATLCHPALMNTALVGSSTASLAWIEAWAHLPSRATDAVALESAHVLRGAQAIKGARAALRRLRGPVPSLADLVAAHALVAPDAPLGLREVPAWFGVRSQSALKLLAPDAESVPDLLSDLMLFLAREPSCPIMVALVCHAQLGLIHPFCDGNGRIARLSARRLLHSTPDAACAFDFYCTKARLVPSKFGEAVLAMALGDFGPLCRLWTTACGQLQAAAQAIDIALNVAEAGLRSVGIAVLKSQRILDLAARSLMVSAADLQRSLGLGVTAASKYLASLRAAGWTEINDGSGQLYMAPMALLDAIDEAHHAPVALPG